MKAGRRGWRPLALGWALLATGCQWDWSGVDRSAAQASCPPGPERGCGLVEVPVGGPFTLGSGEQRQTGITLTEDLRVDSHEVTVRRFRRFWQQAGRPRPEDGTVLRYPEGRELRWEADWALVEPRPATDHPACTWTSEPGTEEQESRPINCVDWTTAQAFCVWDGGRLPTEAEREWLSRYRAVEGLASPRDFPWGDNFPLNHCDYLQWKGCQGAGASPVGPLPVGGKQDVGGLFDVGGNVAEWVADVHRDYPDVGCWGHALQEGPLCDDGPAVLAGEARRGVRGGSLTAAGFEALRNEAREALPPATRSEDIGLRCVRSAPRTSDAPRLQGLMGEYFPGLDLAGPRVKRLDPQVLFNWEEAAPAPGLPADRFSVRWTGKLRPRYSDVYTFVTYADDGLRLWVDGQLLIDDWRHHVSQLNSGTTRRPLQAGRSYDVRLEYFEGGLNAQVGLSWRSARQAEEPIPAERLSPHAPRYPGEDTVGGVVLPDSAWPVPPGAIFVSEDGRDSDPGTPGRPVRTLLKGLEKAPALGTVVLRGGTYRLAEGGGSAPVNLSKPLTLQPYPHERVWLKGSQLVPADAWARDGGAWVASLGALPLPLATEVENLFCFAATCIDPAHPAANHREMVFVDGTALRQVLRREEVAPAPDTAQGTFYVDRAARPARLYLGLDPTGRQVEVTVANQALELSGRDEGAADSAGATVRGLGFAHFAELALKVNRPRVTLQGNAFAWNAAHGVAINGNGGATDVLVRDNVFGHNGRLGLTAFAAHRLRVENNLFIANNTERFLDPGAGLRLARVAGGWVSGNQVRDNQAAGLRLDDSAVEARILRNQVRANAGPGIIVKRSHRTDLASNLLVDNDGAGVLVEESSRTRLFNNTVVDNGGGIALKDGSSRNPDAVSMDAGVTWDVTATVIRNNHLSGGSGPLLGLSDCAGATSAQLVSELDTNAYARPSPSAPATLIRWVDRTCAPVDFDTLGDFKRANPGREDAGVARDGTGTHPLLSAPQWGNYGPRPGALALDGGSPLPADLAEQLGVPAGVPAGIGLLEP
jgi:parallel beta-helix repeat protein